MSRNPGAEPLLDWGLSDDLRCDRELHPLVDCFYEGENMLVIHPDECIDCGVCVPECAAEAIQADTDPNLEIWLELNAKHASLWPNITKRKEPPSDAKEWDGVPNKLEQFNPEPAA